MVGEHALPGGAATLLKAILAGHAELGIDDAQIARLSRIYWGASATASTDDAVAVVAATLSPDQFRKAIVRVANLATADDQVISVPGTIEPLVAEAVGRLTKDRQVVEIELATKVADRVMGWGKIFFFFVAIPVAVILVGLSAIGVSKFDDVRSAAAGVEVKVKDAETKLDAAVKSAQEVSGQAAHVLAQTQQQIADVQTALAAQGQQISSLDNKVREIAESLSFGPGTNLSSEQEDKLSHTASAFLEYFEKLGYIPKTSKINFSTKAVNPEGMISYYYANTIYIKPELVDDDYVLLHEYSHRILNASLPFDFLGGATQWKGSIIPIERGLANYFPGSFLDRTTLGAVAAQRLASQRLISSDRPYLRNLKNNELVKKLVIANMTEAYSLEDAWGGLIWDIRTKLGKTIADKLVYDAWRLLADQNDDTVGRSFVANLLLQAHTRAGADGEAAVREILLRRGLDPSDLPSSTGSR
jgi:hypothetical protein